MNRKIIVVGASKITNTDFLKTDAFKIACDKGYEVFLNNNLEPDILVGDFDTLDKKKIKKPKEIIQLNVIKDDTDTLVAVRRALELGYNHFEFYGCMGGKIDHTIGNIQILSFLLKNNARGFLYSDEDDSVTFMIKSNEKIVFDKNNKGMLSVFSYTDISKGIDEKNLKYELNHAYLDSSFPLGISNEFINKEASISLKEGVLLIITNKNNKFIIQSNS